MVDQETIPTLIERFYHWERQTPDTVFLRQPKGRQWKELTYRQAGQEARSMTTALKDMGLQKGDHVGIYSKNCYHWILADLAIIMGGFVSVPLYANLPKAQLAEVMALSDVKAIFLGKLEVWADKGEAIPAAVLTIRFPHYEGNDTVTIGEEWDRLVERHKPTGDHYVPAPDDLWTILFTSGTTGTPKGVMHPHRNPAQIMIDEFETDWVGVRHVGHFNTFSYLPLNHVGERIGIELTAIWLGGTISFGESLETFIHNLREVQPVLFFSVPRLWMKFYLGVSAKIPPRVLSVLLKIPMVGGILKRKLLHTLGLANVKIAATGSAITPAFLKKWYKDLGIHLIEAYGMTEVCGSFTNGVGVDTPADSVGRIVPGAELRVDEQTSELMLKSPYMMTGYYNDPANTKAVLNNGWLASGDRGTVDEHGFVRIVGRVKDAFKTSKGKYIIPNPIEEKLIQNDHIEQVVVVGLGIPQPMALVNLSEIANNCTQKELNESLEKSLNEANTDTPKYQCLSTIIVDKNPWTLENNMLTPTLKVKRSVVNDKFSADYSSWHEDEQQIVWLNNNRSLQ